MSQQKFTQIQNWLTTTLHDCTTTELTNLYLFEKTETGHERSHERSLSTQTSSLKPQDFRVHLMELHIENRADICWCHPTPLVHLATSPFCQVTGPIKAQTSQKFMGWVNGQDSSASYYWLLERYWVDRVNLRRYWWNSTRAIELLRICDSNGHSVSHQLALYLRSSFPVMYGTSLRWHHTYLLELQIST